MIEKLYDFIEESMDSDAFGILLIGFPISSIAILTVAGLVEANLNQMHVWIGVAWFSEIFYLIAFSLIGSLSVYFGYVYENKYKWPMNIEHWTYFALVVGFTLAAITWLVVFFAIHWLFFSVVLTIVLIVFTICILAIKHKAKIQEE